MDFLKNIDYKQHIGHFAFALVVILLFANILSMRANNDTNKSYYGMDISALVFLIAGFILEYIFHKCPGSSAPLAQKLL
jgi:hypothetical protein